VLKDAAAQKKIVEDCKRRGLAIMGLAVHGNAVHPNPEIAREHACAHDTAVRLARKLGTDVVITFSGCPGGARATKPRIG